MSRKIEVLKEWHEAADGGYRICEYESARIGVVEQQGVEIDILEI